MLDENSEMIPEEIAIQVRTFVHEELCNETGVPDFSLDDEF